MSIMLSKLAYVLIRILRKISFFYPFEVVGLSSETQLKLTLLYFSDLIYFIKIRSSWEGNHGTNKNENKEKGEKTPEH